jgi:hypothetical protein
MLIKFLADTSSAIPIDHRPLPLSISRIMFCSVIYCRKSSLEVDMVQGVPGSCIAIDVLRIIPAFLESFEELLGGQTLCPAMAFKKPQMLFKTGFSHLDTDTTTSELFSSKSLLATCKYRFAAICSQARDA